MKKSSPFFSNENNIQIYRYTETGEFDDDGEPKYTYKLISTIKGDVQPEQADDENASSGEMQENAYKLFCELKTPIKEEDLVKIPVHDEEVLCRVVGRPEYWNHRLIQHQKVHCKELRKQEVNLQCL